MPAQRGPVHAPGWVDHTGENQRTRKYIDAAVGHQQQADRGRSGQQPPAWNHLPPGPHQRKCQQAACRFRQYHRESNDHRDRPALVRQVFDIPADRAEQGASADRPVQADERIPERDDCGRVRRDSPRRRPSRTRGSLPSSRPSSASIALVKLSRASVIARAVGGSQSLPDVFCAAKVPGMRQARPARGGQQ